MYSDHLQISTGCENSACQPVMGGIIASDKCVDGSDCIKVSQFFKDSPAPIPTSTPTSTLFEKGTKLLGETLGTCILVTIIVGSGISAEELSDDVGLQLLICGICVCAGLIGLILMFGPVSGAHFNPVVSMIDFLHGDMDLLDTILYSIAQTVGGICGACLSNLQFNLPIALSTKLRRKPHFWLGEVIATVSLLLVIHGCVRTGQKSAVPYAVGGWVLTGHFFTSSAIFANPAVTIARQFTDTFTGISPSSVGPYIAFQYLGGFIAYGLIRFFYPHNHSLRKDDNLYLRICLQDQKKNV